MHIPKIRPEQLQEINKVLLFILFLIWLVSVALAATA
jgi:hypothetical protein